MISRPFAAGVAIAAALLFLGSCLVVRGGLTDSAPYGDVHLYATYGHEMVSGKVPYRDFFDEYPPFAQPVFAAVRILPGTYASGFRWTMAALGVGALGLMLLTLAHVGASRWRYAGAALAVGIAPLLIGPVFLNTYDLWPVALTSGALLALVRRHDRTGYVLLALAVAAKVYPVVLLPLVLAAAWKTGGREAVRRASLWFAGALAIVHLPFLIAGPGGLRFSYWVQLKRGLEVESLGGGLLLLLDRLGLYHAHLVLGSPGSTNLAGGVAAAVAAVSSLVSVAAALVVARLYVRRTGVPLLAAAAAVVGFAAFGKVFSPQYVDWLVPLVPAAGAAASAALLGVLGLTHVVFDRFHAPATDAAQYKAALVWWVVARDLALVALYALLVLRLRRSPVTSST